MRVSFSIPLEPKSGKHKFAILLAAEMRRQGIKVTNKRPDVNLVFLKGLNKKCKNIFRLDGVWMNTRVNLKKNNKIKTRMRACDGIIYQNEFCRQAGEKFIGRFDNHSVIMNGCKLPENIEPFKTDRPYILTFARWRPHKRLKETVMGFLRSGMQSDFDLIVLGKNPDYVVKDSSVKYMGFQSKKLWSIICGCTFAVHLAYIDWCPNSVVESLIAGKNVLHSITGGTKDVVRNNGIAVKDKPWNFKPIDLYSPPPLNKEELSKAYKSMLALKSPSCDYLKIEHSTKQYINYCHRILND